VEGLSLSVNSKAGELPIMVMSNKCCLRSLSPKKLVAYREEATECGGYFIMNGIERVIRLLQIPRRNYAMAIERSRYGKNIPPTPTHPIILINHLFTPAHTSITTIIQFLYYHTFI
jgi:DNA-directed RNA polymerase I subunit RPA2